MGDTKRAIVSRTALVVVDVQNDFCPGGSLAVPDGDRVVAPINTAIHAFLTSGLPVYATRDWHPSQTVHFTSGGGPWPSHCVQDSEGAEFHPELDLTGVTILSKGMSPESDSYSGFDAVDEADTPILDLLRGEGVTDLVVAGLATDYCVRATVLDARRAGFGVRILQEGIAAVELKDGDGERAMSEMTEAGATVLSLETALSQLDR